MILCLTRKVNMMTRREFLQEQYEEALFALLMDDLAVEEGKKALEEHGRLQNDPEAAVPDQTIRQGLKTIRRSFSRQSAGKVGRVTAKLVSRVAVVALVGMLTFTTAFAASTDFRISTINYIIDVFDDRTIFSTGMINSNEVKTIYAGWLPVGYEQSDCELTDGYLKVLFRDKTGQEIIVRVIRGNKINAIDTENAEVGTFVINDYEAVTIVKQGSDGFGMPYAWSKVIWVDSARECYIDITSYDENIDVLIRFAKELILE